MDKINPRRLTREQLKLFLGDNPDLIRAFERYIEALTTIAPDEINDVQVLASAAQDIAAAARSVAARAAQSAAELETMVQTSRTQSAAIDSLRRDLNDLRALTQGA